MTTVGILRSKKEIACATACAGALLAATAQGQETPVRISDFQVVASRPSSLDLPVTTVEISTPHLADLSDAAANFHVADSGAGTFGALTSIRGLSNTPYFSDTAVAIYLDDLPLGGGFATPAMLLGYNRAELIRGPGGAFLSGRGAVGGTLFLSSFAGNRAPHAQVSVTAGDHGSYAGAATLRATQKKWSASVDLGVERDDGFLFNTITKKQVDAHDHQFGAARISYSPFNDTEISLQAIATRGRDGTQPLVPLGGPLRTVERERDGKLDSRFEGLALRGTTGTDFGTLSSVTSYTHWEMSPFSNSLVLPPALDSVLSQSQEAFNEEVRLRSLDTAHYPWFAGVWFNTSNTLGKASRTMPDVVFPDGSSYAEGSTYRSRSDSYAFFGESVLMVDEGWTLTGGLRAETTRKKLYRTDTVSPSGSWAGKTSLSNIKPRFVVSWDMDPMNRAEFAWSLAAKPGGFSAYAASVQAGAFKPEKTQAFEGSWKSRTSNTTVLTLRAFHYKISDYQIEQSLPYPSADYVVVNAPHATSTGGELEGSIDLSPQLQLILSAGLQDVKLGTFADPFTETVTHGKHAPYAPRSTVHAELVYKAGQVTTRVSATRTGKTHFDEVESAMYSQDTYTTVQASAMYAFRRWTLEASVRNLTGTEYYTLIIPGIAHAAPGAPRTVRLTLGYQW